FDVELLAEVSGQEDADLVEECLLEAVRTHLLRASGPGTYTFGHDKIREALYDEVTSVRRRRLHGFIGRALEARNEPEGAQTQLAAPQHLAELAFHFARSGDRARGAMYARQAAEQALSTYAPEDAIAHYRAALGFADTSDAQRGELLLGLGNAALLANSHAEAVAAFEAAQSWYERAGENEGAARAAHRLGNAWWQQEAIPQARIAFETAVALFAGRPIPESVTALVDLSSLLTLSLNQHDEGRKYAKQALELALQIGDERLIASARRALGNLMVRAGDLEGGKAVLVEALDLAAIADDPAEAAECCACLTMASTWSGNFKHAVDYAQRQIEFARRCHAHYLLRHVYTHLALFYFYQGRLDQAEQMAAEEQLVLGRSGNTEAQAYLDIVKSLLAAQGRGQFAEGLQLAEGALTAWRGLNSNSVVWHLGNLAVLQAVAEKRDDALALLDELEATMAVLPPGSAPFIMVLDQMATTGLLLGERERERLFRFYPMLASFRGRIGNSIIDRLLGEIETLQGDFAGAQVSLAAAEAIARREDIVWELAFVLVARANLALAVKGEKSTETARALLVEGLDLFDKYGSTPISERVRDTLRTLNGPRRGSAKERPALPSGLSVREAEVLRHVAAGRTNREIAEELVLSEKTVNNHLERIFAKIGANNRAAASAFAVRHNLAK
ncbi:MAG TPA: LuxR C-terminal-related transcriptional regulator, partial [Chloroflexia bacterium]|nr:LuxR C-terminal-related transcriptional regulator [Chloroflexia bacterium]